LASQPLKITAFIEDTLIEAEACLWQPSLPRFHDLLALLIASDEAQNFQKRRRYEQVSAMTGKGRCHLARCWKCDTQDRVLTRD
jgi:hypothetical protein